ncbi:MAG: phage tail sheath family protein [Phaeodactylibacter sp.]|nr:phage tail sheath family protein [Phaeodactylibacter sp.]MCB9274946.1 phage tail sheath family protein [Lewinellaceae bacterium]
MLNLNNVKTPGAYIDEVSLLPPSVAAVETAIPAFIGYTEANPFGGTDFPKPAVRIKSLKEYESLFGGPFNQSFSAVLGTVNGADGITTAPVAPTLVYRMYYALQLYFANGGGPCYIICTGAYNTTTPAVAQADLLAGLPVLAKEDEPTLILFPDAVAITNADENTAYSQYYQLYTEALAQCEALKDRFTIVDVYHGDQDFQQAGGPDIINDDPNSFRGRIGTLNLKYGAAYYPWLETSLSFAYDPAGVAITGTIGGVNINPDNVVLRDDNAASPEVSSLFHRNNALYHLVKAAIEKFRVTMPPGPLAAGVYASVDSTRGVWKAPANVSLSGITRPLVKVDNDAQDGLNVHTSGKSVNVIRSFTGKGILVWGARTLAGNDNEWRYVSVRRFFNMVEESVKKASEQFVFEPNDANTWNKVRAMIENFLLNQWRAGALAGAKPDDAFFVKVGLGQTMTALDILEGRMIVEIGMAVVRPAEFIILRFSHKMQVS